MENIKIILFRFPEYYLIILAFGLGYKSPLPLALFSAILIVVFALQLIYKNKLAGTVIASLFGVANFCFLLALLSEFREFSTFSAGAQSLLFVGLPLFIINSIMVIVMVYKYALNPATSAPQNATAIS